MSGIEVYSLSPLGKSMARSVKNPNNNSWRIVHFLDGVGSASKDKIVEYCGIGVGEASMALIRLRNKHIIVEETAVQV